MSDQARLAQRVEALELTVAELQRQIVQQRMKKSWVEDLGRPMSEEDHEAFDQRIEFGRQFRQADWPSDKVEDE
jgi:hypothetical protein